MSRPPVAEFCIGGDYTCRLLDGGVTCWGSNQYGQVEPGGEEIKAPHLVVDAGVRSIACGALHVCAISSNGLSCWGTPPARDAGLPMGADQVAAGERHTCAVVGGSAQCWGDNDVWQAPENVGLPGPVTSISSRGEHSCASSEGGAYCWGAGAAGQLGIGSAPQRSAVQLVSGLTEVMQVCAGSAHSCAQLASGEVFCWGQNYRGQLGDGTREDRLGPVGPVRLSSGAKRVACGASATCAITSQGTLTCWGDNACDIFGDAGTTTEPTEVADEVATVALGDGTLCFSRNDGSWLCRGRNSVGQIRLPVSECATRQGK